MDEQLIAREEFLEKYAALHDSIFRFREYGPPSWNRFLPEFPFVNKNWEVALLSYGELVFEDVDFLALMQAALAIGDHELIMICADENRKGVLIPPGKTEAEGTPVVFEQGITLRWDPEALKQARSKSDWYIGLPPLWPIRYLGSGFLFKLLFLRGWRREVYGSVHPQSGGALRSKRTLS